MNEALKQAYEKAEEIKNSNEYKFLASMFTELYKEKQEINRLLEITLRDYQELSKKYTNLKLKMENKI